MPPWAWILVAIAVVLLATWLHDRRARRRGARLNGPEAMARGLGAAQADPEAHRGALTENRYLPPPTG